ncbi:MAG TPA: FtsX-like permease family protein [Gemmatimonadaceae bacterium]|nr:FtsX-like permease family protein [Gemmatimonadaceae bacterium]
MIRIALRTLGRHRGFAAVAILSLAVAIALNTTMYSVLDALISPRIDARKPENLYRVRYFTNDARRTDFDAVTRALSRPARSFEAATGSGGAPYFRMALIENGARYDRAFPSIVRPNYFDVLGTHAISGRTFIASDTVTGRPAVLSDKLAAKLFPDQSPVGRTITVDGVGYTVVGVVARSDLFGPLYAKLWILRPENAPPTPITFVRIRDGVDTLLLGRELKQIAAQLALSSGIPAGQTGFLVHRFETYQFHVGEFHLALFGAVAAVLLVACANLANLQLARGLARQRELALRSAVGASRGQLIRHLVMESGVLAFAGLVLGTVLALWSVHLVKAAMPEVMNEYVVAPQISWRVFAFAATAALVCLFLVGLVPAVQVSRVDPDTLLKSGSGTGANRTHRRRYGALVVAQVGLALPVLIGAIAVIKSSVRFHSRDFVVDMYGYDPSQLVSASAVFTSDTAGVMPLGQAMSEMTTRVQLSQGVVDAAASASRYPVKRTIMVDDDNGVVREERVPLWSYSVVSSQYFRTFGSTMERGRDFLPGEVSRSVIIDLGTARYLWGLRDPIGRQIRFGDARSAEPWYRVIGVERDLRDTAALRRHDYSWGFHMGRVYRPVQLDDTLQLMPQNFPSLNVYARVQGNPELAAVRLQRHLRQTRGNEHVSVIPMTDAQSITYARRQQDFVSALFSTFAVLGIALVAIGVYGIVAHSVAERRRELAVRISLGATARDVLRSVLREGNVLLLAGLAFGLLFTKYTVWWLGQFLEDDVGYNAPLFALIATLLFAVATFAAFIPAWRATRIDPVEALRHE